MYFMSVKATFAVTARTRMVSRRPCTCPTTGNILILHKTLPHRETAEKGRTKCKSHVDLTILGRSVIYSYRTSTRKQWFDRHVRWHPGHRLHHLHGRHWAILHHVVSHRWHAEKHGAHCNEIHLQGMNNSFFQTYQHTNNDTFLIL